MAAKNAYNSRLKILIKKFFIYHATLPIPLRDMLDRAVPSALCFPKQYIFWNAWRPVAEQPRQQPVRNVQAAVPVVSCLYPPFPREQKIL